MTSWGKNRLLIVWGNKHRKRHEWLQFQQRSKKSSGYHSVTSPVALKTNPSPPCLDFVFIIKASVSILCLSHAKNHTVERGKLGTASECDARSRLNVELGFLCGRRARVFSGNTVSSPGSSWNSLWIHHDYDQDKALTLLFTYIYILVIALFERFIRPVLLSCTRTGIRSMERSWVIDPAGWLWWADVQSFQSIKGSRLTRP